jgi:2-amino-4-hydroxy-6-hydroxymethyldihydropteridine diphosphokinase
LLIEDKLFVNMYLRESMPVVFLSLGSNQGDSRANLSKVVDLLSDFSKVLEVSSVYITRPWGNVNQPDFLNLALSIQTNLPADKLLYELQQIEKKIGRVKEEKWGPRLIDIDILFYGGEIIHDHELQIPHPQAHLRTFVLIPMQEIAPDFKHPSLGQTISELLTKFADQTDAESIGKLE